MHSIQDYSALSYVSELEYFKKNRKRISSLILLVYHSDWTIEDKYKKKRKKLHKKNKDNPYKDFVIKDVYGYWKKVDKKEENERYMKVIEDSKTFLYSILCIVSPHDCSMYLGE